MMSDDNKNPENPESPAPEKKADTPPADPKAPDAKSENPENPAPEKKAEDEPALYRPEGIDDHLIGKNDHETIDNLLKRTKGLRDELANKKGLPDKFDDYTIEFSKEDEEKFLSKNEDGVDPVFEIMRKVAYEEGVPQGAAGNLFKRFAEEMYRQLEESAQQNQNADDQGLRADFEFKGYGGADKARPLQEAANAWVDAMAGQKKISEEAAFELKLLATHQGGLEALEALRVMAGEKPIPAKMEGGAPSGELSEGKLHQMMRDPRYWKEKDPQFIAEVTAGFKRLYGDAA